MHIEIKKRITGSFVSASALMMACGAQALETLSDQELGSVRGQDGVTISLQIDPTESITA